ncbi:MAG: IMS domain-containing protein [Chloroflexi bacterium]|nr:IMS domain-containing protein [Chloroflexota bacterium]
MPPVNQYGDLEDRPFSTAKTTGAPGAEPYGIPPRPTVSASAAQGTQGGRGVHWSALLLAAVLGMVGMAALMLGAGAVSRDRAAATGPQNAASQPNPPAAMAPAFASSAQTAPPVAAPAAAPAVPAAAPAAAPPAPPAALLVVPTATAASLAVNPSGYQQTLQQARQFIDQGDEASLGRAVAQLQSVRSIVPEGEAAHSWLAEAEIRLTLHRHDRARALASGPMYDTRLLQETTVDPRLRDLVDTANRYRASSSYYEFDTRSYTIQSLALSPSAVNPTDAEVMVQKDEHRIFRQPGKAPCNVDEVYTVRYVLKRLSGAWKIAIAQALDNKSPC